MLQWLETCLCGAATLKLGPLLFWCPKSYHLFLRTSLENKILDIFMVTPHSFQDVSSLTSNWTLTLGSESMESSPLNNQGILRIFGIFEVRKGYLWTGERVENWGMKTVKANLTSCGAQEIQELILSCQLWGFIFTSILPQVPWELWSNMQQRGVHKLHRSLSWAEKEGRKEMKVSLSWTSGPLCFVFFGLWVTWWLFGT